MASLNLDALKNMGTTPAVTPVTPAETTTVTPPKTVTATVPREVEKSPTKKLSLMSLKKSSPVENTVIKVTKAETPIVEIKVEEPKKEKIILPKISLVAKEPAVIQEVVAIPETIEEKAIVEMTAVETIKTEEVVSVVLETSSESVSLSIEGMDNTEEESESPKEDLSKKEFFPNLKSIGKIQLHEDMDIIEEGLPIIASQTPVEKTETIEEEAIEIETGGVVMNEIVETVEETISIQGPALEENINKEYVEEVKAELSEGRRAGFRYFMEKKIRIFTGIGVIVSLSIIAIVSNSFLTSSAPVGKSNIQETITPVEVNNITPPVETQGESGSTIPETTVVNMENPQNS